MIFALHSYLQYRLRRGAFGSRQRDGAMAMAWMDRAPRWVLDGLEPGDMVFTQRLNSALSWAMMYMSSSPVDHVGVIDPDGRVLHMTLSGVRQHGLNTLAKGARVVVFRPDIAGLEKPFEVTEGRLYRGGMRSLAIPAKLQLAFGAVGIALGAFPERFRWKFLADLAITLGLVDLGLMGMGVSPKAWLVTLVLLSITVANLAFAQLERAQGRPPLIISHPDQGYRACFRYGGYMTSTLGPLAVTGFGVMPLDFFLRLQERLGVGGEGTDDGADDHLQEARRLGSRRLEDRDLRRLMGEAEANDE